MTHQPRYLIYYFAFPHYRRAILNALATMEPAQFDFVSGSSSRANISTLESGEVPGLITVPTRRLGGLSWDRSVFGQAIDRRYHGVILGPATLSLSTWGVLFARWITRRNVYLWGQCGRAGDRSVKRFVQELMNRMATRIFVYGQAEASAATELGLDPKKVVVVHNATRSNADVLAEEDGEDLLARAQAAALRGQKRGDLRLLFVGRLNGQKRIEVLLDAATRLRERYPNLTIDLIGDGDARASLQKTYPFEWVKFHGWVYEPELVDRYFRDATLVCSPYHMGLLAVDALRAGTPVLVPDNPMNGSEVESLTPGVNSIRFAQGNAASIVAAVSEWFKTVGDVNVTEFSAMRRKALSTWDPEGVAKAILAGLREGGVER